MVVAEDVRDGIQLGLRGTHGHRRHHGGTAVIQALSQRIKLYKSLLQTLVLPRDRDLVGDAPREYRGVVFCLNDEFFELRKRVKLPFLRKARDDGHFRPHQQPRPVAKGVEVVGVLIMRKAHRVRTHFLYELYVLLLHFGSERVAHALPVLMTGDALDLEMPAVQEKALVRIEGEISEPRLYARRVPALYAAREGVKVGIVHIPKVRTGESDDGVSRRAFDLGDARLLPFRVLQRECDVGALRGGGHLEVYRKLPAALFLARRRPYARAVGRGQEMFFGADKQAHAPVKTAVEGEVRHGGIDRLVGGIVHRDLQLGRLLQPARQLRPKR